MKKAEWIALIFILFLFTYLVISSYRGKVLYNNQAKTVRCLTCGK